MASMVWRISLLSVRPETKKEMGGSLPPISFWTPCEAPPGPPQTIVVRLGAIQRAGLSLGVRLAYCSKARRSTFTAFGGKFFTPSQSPDRLSHAAKRLFQRSVFFHRKTNSLCSVSFRLWCFGYNQTPACESLIARHGVPASQEKGPLHAKRPREIIRCESGERSPPLLSQLCTRRFPDAGPSDHDIDRLKIPLDIGSPPLCCFCR